MHFPEVLDDGTARNVVLGRILERLEITFVRNPSLALAVVAAGLLL